MSFRQTDNTVRTLFLGMPLMLIGKAMTPFTGTYNGSNLLVKALLLIRNLLFQHSNAPPLWWSKSLG